MIPMGLIADDISELKAEIGKLQAKLARYEGALKEIGYNPDRYSNWTSQEVARETLEAE